jgi:hypothetical protein
MTGLNLLLNFLPMVLIYLIATYSPEVAKWSHTILGKVIAISIILLYTFTDIISGLLACSLVIFYYQSDYVESFTILQEQPTDVPDNQPKNTKEYSKDLELIDDAYPENPDVLILYDNKVDNFRKKHCEKGHLIHKGQIVKPESAEHVFPEITQDKFHKCNICDPECSFDLNLINIEDDLVNPKSSKDWFIK